jgi:dolichol kinase
MATMEPVNDPVWPDLSKTQLGFMIGVPIAALGAIIFLLRVVWPPPPPQEASSKMKPMSINGPDEGTLLLEAGEVAGDYKADWTRTFDLVFLSGMTIGLGLLLIVTALTWPEVWTNYHFWISQLPKLFVMMTVSLLGGMCCRYFCEVDSMGYITTNKSSVFKVNYTRKLQHFAAYAVPLVVHSGEKGPLALAWGDWFTLLGFMLLIKPIRERSSFFMLQFNSLDRPEDRPNTLKWIVGGNILPGLCLILLFRWIFDFNHQADLSWIFIMITGIGDGFAEPVGILWGKHKYWTRGCLSRRRYQRSYEGSACVFLSAIIFCGIFWYGFSNAYQFWAAVIIMAPAMTWAEAVSPHTMDTPFLMGLGGLILLGCTHLSISTH